MKKILIFFFLLIAGCTNHTLNRTNFEFNPEKYVCYLAVDTIHVDGELDELSWIKAKWTNYFVDIRGRSLPAPHFHTRVKMLWDNDYFYIAAQLEEPDIYGSRIIHDDTLFKDNNFEVFIDPDGNTHKYCELEINALNTVWDLFLIKPYRDLKKPALTGWDIKGLKNAVAIYGTLNNASDMDSCWQVEIALPWKVFSEFSTTNIPPRNNNQWRVNFGRIEWKTIVVDGKYIKQIDAIKKRPVAAFWAWSPIGIINYHYPEKWGYVQFSNKLVGNGKTEFIEKEEEKVKWFLRQIYYKESNYFKKYNKYTSDIPKLNIKNKHFINYITPPIIECTTNTFEATVLKNDKSKKISIREDGLIFQE